MRSFPSETCNMHVSHKDGAFFLQKFHTKLTFSMQHVELEDIKVRHIPSKCPLITLKNIPFLVCCFQVYILHTSGFYFIHKWYLFRTLACLKSAKRGNVLQHKLLVNSQNVSDLLAKTIYLLFSQ